MTVLLAPDEMFAAGREGDLSASKILIVDPDSEHRNNLATLLRARGYEVLPLSRANEVESLRPLDLPAVAIIDDDSGDVVRGLVERGVVTFGMSAVLTGIWNRDYAIARDRVAEYWDKPVPIDALDAWLRRVRSMNDRSTPVSLLDAAQAMEVPHSAEIPLAEELSLEDEAASPGVQAPNPSWSAAFEAASDPAARSPSKLGPDDATLEGARVPQRLDPRLIQDAGDLGDFAFPTLLAALAYRRATGALMLHAGDDKRLVYFVDGFAVSARTNREDALSVADVALQSGLISAAQHRLAVARGGSSHAGIARALVETGAMQAEDIDLLASTELRNRLLDVFEWESGRFAFRESAVPPHLQRDPVISPMDLIWQGIQHGTPLKTVRTVLESELGSPFVWLTEPPTADDMGLTRSQQRVLALLNGVLSLHDLSREGVVNEDAQRFLFLLLATGFLGWE